MKKWMLLLVPLLFSPAIEAANDKAAKTRAAFDRMDREDFLDGLEQAGKCTQAGNFGCADQELARIRELISDDEQQQLWVQAGNDIKAARSRVASLRAAEEQEQREQEREVARRNAEAKQKMFTSLMGSAMIAANSRELGADKAGRMMDAWNADVQRGDGNYSSSNALVADIRAENRRELEASRQRVAEQRAREQEKEEARRAALQVAATKPAGIVVAAVPAVMEKGTAPPASGKESTWSWGGVPADMVQRKAVANGAATAVAAAGSPEEKKTLAAQVSLPASQMSCRQEVVSGSIIPGALPDVGFGRADVSWETSMANAEAAVANAASYKCKAATGNPEHKLKNMNCEKTTGLLNSRCSAQYQCVASRKVCTGGGARASAQ